MRPRITFRASEADVKTITARLVLADARIPWFAKFVEIGANGCWIWRGSRDKWGYGLLMVSGFKLTKAHRYSYLSVHGEVPPQLDHFACDTPSCVNPDHVRPATSRENTLRSSNAAAKNARKTHCQRGHLFEPGSYFLIGGRRHCKECGRKQSREWIRKRRMEAIVERGLRA